MKKTILNIKRDVTFLTLPLLGGVGWGLLLSCSSNENNYDAMGVFEATEVVVSAKVQGELISLDLNEGDEVKADSTLGFIDATKLNLQQQSLQDNRDAQTARILNLQEQTASIQQQINNLQQEYERFSGLLTKGAATQKQVDDLANQIKVMKAQFAATQSQLRSANESIQHQASASDQQMKIVGSQMDEAIIKSPISGTILKKYGERGEYAVPGKALFKVADLQEMILRAYITADQFDRLKLGQKVKVMVDNGNETQREYKGKVTWIAQKAEFTPKTIQTKDERANLVYAIKVSVKNDGMIKIGQYGECYFNK